MLYKMRRSGLAVRSRDRKQSELLRRLTVKAVQKPCKAQPRVICNKLFSALYIVVGDYHNSTL